MYVTNNDEKRALNILRTHLEKSEEVDDNIFSCLNSIENTLDLQFLKCNCKYQTKITDFRK